MAPNVVGAGTERGASADVHAAVRDAIVTGEFVPNQRLVEADLAERFGASRAAIRTALVRLTTDGLVERVPNRGARVRAVSLAEVLEITEVRMVVEELCVVRAAGGATLEEAEFLDPIADAMKEAVGAHDLLRYSELDLELHRALRHLGRHATACGVVERLEGHTARHRLQLILNPDRLAASLDEHLAIVQAVRGGDEDGAARALRSHLTAVLEALQDGRAAARLCG